LPPFFCLQGKKGTEGLIFNPSVPFFAGDHQPCRANQQQNSMQRNVVGAGTAATPEQTQDDPRQQPEEIGTAQDRLF
jgi:hypothetical protein